MLQLIYVAHTCSTRNQELIEGDGASTLPFASHMYERVSAAVRGETSRRETSRRGWHLTQKALCTVKRAPLVLGGEPLGSQGGARIRVSVSAQRSTPLLLYLVPRLAPDASVRAPLEWGEGRRAPLSWGKAAGLP